jgi:hypothetical protein
MPVTRATVRESLRHVAFGEVEAIVGNQGVVTYLLKRKGCPIFAWPGSSTGIRPAQGGARRLARIASIQDKALNNLPKTTNRISSINGNPCARVPPPPTDVFVQIGLLRHPGLSGLPPLIPGPEARIAEKLGNSNRIRPPRIRGKGLRERPAPAQRPLPRRTPSCSNRPYGPWSISRASPGKDRPIPREMAGGP